jgi:Metalloenzyme superfamily.
MNDKKIVMVVMDGVGDIEKNYGNAVNNAYTPTLNDLKN